MPRKTHGLILPLFSSGFALFVPRVCCKALALPQTPVCSRAAQRSRRMRWSLRPPFNGTGLFVKAFLENDTRVARKGFHAAMSFRATTCSCNTMYSRGFVLHSALFCRRKSSRSCTTTRCWGQRGRQKCFSVQCSFPYNAVWAECCLCIMLFSANAFLCDALSVQCCFCTMLFSANAFLFCTMLLRPAAQLNGQFSVQTLLLYDALFRAMLSVQCQTSLLPTQKAFIPSMCSCFDRTVEFRFRFLYNAGVCSTETKGLSCRNVHAPLSLLERLPSSGLTCCDGVCSCFAVPSACVLRKCCNDHMDCQINDALLARRLRATAFLLSRPCLKRSLALRINYLTKRTH